MNSPKLVIGHIFIDEIEIEPNSLLMFSGCHPPLLAHDQRVLGFLFKDVVHLPSLLNAELQDLEHIFHEIVLKFVVNRAFGVGSQTWHVVHLKQPGF